METAGLREQHLVTTEWLAARLDESGIRVVDVRGYVRAQTEPDGRQTAEYEGAREEYAAGHIPGATYIDWTTDIVDLTDSVAAQVAPADKIAQVMGAAGIGRDSMVIAYDNHPASQFATRLWWVLRYYGHDRVRVLDGGLAKWKAEGRPLSTDTPVVKPQVFEPRVRPHLRVTAEELAKRLADPALCLIDARDVGQYSGRIRRGPRGGHIPGARSLPREALFAPDSTFLPTDRLRSIMTDHGIDERGQKDVVAYCNGGVAATSVLFALSMLGLENLSNYDGSWNEWSYREDLPVSAEA